jgi:hypothetical protein
MLQLAAILIVLLAIAHSVLGERYILTRLFRRELPKLFGGPEFTRNTLRFAWHLTTLLAFGLGAVLWLLPGSPPPELLARVVGWLLIGSGLLPLVFTRGRHLSWVVLFAAGGLSLARAAPNNSSKPKPLRGAA